MLIELTAEGSHWLESRDSLYLLALVHSRTRYVGEMLRAIHEGVRTPSDLLDDANQHFSAGWTTRAQIDRRRQILGGVGAIEASGDGFLSTTELGRHALVELDLHEPGEPLEQARAAKPDELNSTVEPTPSGARNEQLQTIIQRLEASAHDSKDPDALEQAACEDFAFLGFKAKWLGGAGKTDVLLAAELGPREQYR